MEYDGLRGASSEAIGLLEGFWPRIMREIQNFQPVIILFLLILLLQI